jgi:hypothetical protein
MDEEEVGLQPQVHLEGTAVAGECIAYSGLHQATGPC